MTNHVARIIEVVGTSDIGIDDAVKAGVEKAAQEVGDIQWFEIREMRGSVSGDKVERFQVILKVAHGLT